MSDLNPLELDLNLQSEGILLGNILSYGRDAMERALSLIEVDDFQNEGFANIYKAMIADYEMGGDLSVQSIKSAYKKKLGKSIKISRLTALFNIDGRIGASLETCAQVMKENHKELILKNLANEILSSGELEPNNIARMINARMEQFTKVDLKTTSLLPISTMMDSMIITLKNRSESKGGITGLASGFGEIDKITAGWQNGTMVVIAARPAMGKTAFALSMIKNLCEQNIPVAFFSLEMSAEQILFRLLSNVAGVEHNKLQTGNGLTQTDWANIQNARERINAYPLYIDDNDISLYNLRLKCKQAVKEQHIKIVVIDYLQLMTENSKKGNRQEEVATISRGLKLLSKDLGVPIIVLAQLNRNVEARNGANKKPQLSDLRESGAIEQDADIVAFLHRPEYYKIETLEDGSPSAGKGLFIIAKHRAGRCDEVILNWMPEYVKFSDDTSSPRFFTGSTPTSFDQNNDYTFSADGEEVPF